MPEVKVRQQEQPVVTAAQARADDEYFELQPIEKKLITYSLVLGIGLLVVFILAFEVFK
ncbi:hypothetical protein Desca_2285 [Desulfotomaculum nigrificans CO-1-SRB]|uniref:Uncharacterized protein n=1 Tax=Desulfotomaculum nigrificans (strain DSM 14880 / VKM B-2319 / CO-1-SRB) TaxID=868595 RepID=F6B389_DESCC|nr:hypothetical protein [Desulfotomaculum nigrificans]AEF95120.1 hypothetical protein Desca_2285 [Desulfotomaculum nigrificans CO-1-SRB]